VRPLLPLLAAAAIGCSNITDVGNGVVELDVTIPPRLELEIGDTLQLSARALDRNGEVVAAEITWATPDPTIGVVAATGEVTGLAPGPGRVQAVQGTLISDFLTFNVLGRADSLALPAGGAVTVAADAQSSAPLAVTLLGAPDVTLAGHRVILTITAPAFADPATRTVQFPNGALADTVTTAADGTLATPVTVDRVSGTTAPATATVTVEATRPSGAAVPGSGQTFTVTFE
jgi:hypothetical protein